MELSLLFSHYLIWHYSIGLADLFRVFGNFLWFIWNFFSIPLLLKTLFSPWRRMSEDKKKQGLHPEEFFGNLLVNMIMRVVGIFARLIMILFGLVFLVLTAGLGMVAILIWLTLPVAIPFLFILGLKLIFL